MYVRDEADIIEATVRHLLWHVDEVIVADNRSVDGTREILERLPVDLREAPEVGHWQERTTNAMAMEALERGHEWVLPVDADEIWHCDDPRLRIGDWLARLAPTHVMIVRARIFNHVPSADDPPHEPNPVRRIAYRKVYPEKRKVACRLTPDLWIKMGNHSARMGGAPLTIPGLNLRHFQFRSEEQTVRKVRNTIESHTAAGGIGRHRRITFQHYDGRSDEDIRSDFRHHFSSERPEEDGELIFDPAPAYRPARYSEHVGPSAPRLENR